MDISLCDASVLGTCRDHLSVLVIAQVDLKGIIDKLTAQLTLVMTAVGLLGVLLWAIAQVISPMIPDWAQSIKGYFQKAMVALIVAGFASGLVTWLYGLGQS